MDAAMLTCNAHLFTFFHGTALKTWCLHSTVTSHSENGKFRFPPTQIIEIIHWDGPLHWPPWSGETIWRYWEGFLWSQSPGLTLTVLHLLMATHWSHGRWSSHCEDVATAAGEEIPRIARWLLIPCWSLIAAQCHLDIVDHSECSIAKGYL